MRVTGNFQRILYLQYYRGHTPSLQMRIGVYRQGSVNGQTTFKAYAGKEVCAARFQIVGEIRATIDGKPMTLRSDPRTFDVTYFLGGKLANVQDVNTSSLSPTQKLQLRNQILRGYKTALTQNGVFIPMRKNDLILQVVDDEVTIPLPNARIVRQLKHT